MAALLGAVLDRRLRARPSVLLPDAKRLEVEALTYGTIHELGRTSPLFMKLASYLPASARNRLLARLHHSKIKTKPSGLALWITAIDSRTHKSVACNGLEVELLDSQSHPYRSSQGGVSTGDNFWRAGWGFDSFPRADPLLTLRIYPPGEEASPLYLHLRNPHPTPLGHWKGRPLPQQQRVGEYDMVLAGLQKVTNATFYTSRAPWIVWEPQLELWKAGQRVTGWTVPEWMAEDTLGNFDRHIGAYQKSVRFHVTWYPEGTNLTGAIVLTNTPAFCLTNLTNNLVWNFKTHFQGKELTILGLVPPGNHAFSNGIFQPNPPPGIDRSGSSITSGGGWARSGAGPSGKEEWVGFHDRTAALFITAPQISTTIRLAVRLRDAQGRMWNAHRQSNGGRDFILHFGIEDLHGSTNVTAEIVALQPLDASFEVDTTAQY